MIMPANKDGAARTTPSKPTVAIIGRENVGKSTLFNTLTGKKQVIVSKEPGTTRDRIFGDVLWRGHEFMLIDTAGLAHNGKQFVDDIHEQVRYALEEADVILFLTDGKDGVTPVDQKIARWLMKEKKKTPVVVGVNKIDQPQKEQSLLLPFYDLGFESLVPLSALSGKQVGDLLDALYDVMPHNEVDTTPAEIRVSLVGKPNSGKSTLLNTLTGSKRSRTSAEPGTTRDVVYAPVMHEGKKILFLDTAGMRRKAKISAMVEKLSVSQSLRAINESDVVLLMIDTTVPVSQQDLAIIRYAQEARRALILVISKWDLESKQEKKFEKYVTYFQKKLPHLPWIPLIFVSSNTKQNIDHLLELIEHVHQSYTHWISEDDTKILEENIKKNLVTVGKMKKKRLVTYGFKQVAIAPPAFEIEINDPLLILSYQIGAVEKMIRERYPFDGTPIILHFKWKKKDA